MDQSAAGRYVADFRLGRYGSYLLKAIHKRPPPGRTCSKDVECPVVAESMGSVSLPYPLEYLRSTPDPEPMRQAAMVTGGTDQAAAKDVWDARGETIPYTQDLWPWVLLGVIGLFILDLYAKRVRLFGYRTIRFR
jgi:hypothetical protein